MTAIDVESVRCQAWLDQKWTVLTEWAAAVGDEGTLAIFDELQKAHGDPGAMRLALMGLNDGRISIVWSLAFVGIIEVSRRRREREAEKVVGGE